MADGDSTRKVDPMVARVERLERQYDSLSGIVQAMAVDVAVARTKSESIESGVADIRTQLAALLVIGQSGKLIEQELDHVEKEKTADHAVFSAGIASAKAEISKVKLWVATATGAIMVLVFIANVFAPLIQKFLGVR